mgnify:CR=1 FL=1
MSYTKTGHTASAHATEQQGVDTPTEQSLDMTVFDSMKSIMEDEFAELIEAFYLSTDEVIETMDGWDQWQASDDFRRQPHSLKSIAGNIGAMKMKELAAQCEAQINDGLLDDAKATYALIGEEYHQVRQLLQSLSYPHTYTLGKARAANH